MKKFVNFRLILFLAVSLCLGTATAYFCVVKNLFLSLACPLSFIIAIILYLFYAFKNKDLVKGAIFSLLFSLVFVTGALNFDLRVNDYKNADLENHYFTIVGRVNQEKDTEYGKYLVLDKVNLDGVYKGDINYKVAVYVEGEVDYQIGNVIFFESTLFDKSIFYDEKFSSYDVVRGIKYTANVNAEEVYFVKDSPTIFQSINRLIKENLRSGYQGDEFSVAYAMLTGNDEYIAPETISSYRQAGVAHIFAVSGLHIGFVAFAIGFLLDKFKCNRSLKVFIIVPILIFYAGVCGFSASSIRATVMSAVLLSSSVFGVKYDKLTSLSLASIIILLISPIELFCAGFQLSFGVVFGMFTLSPVFSRLFKFLPSSLKNSISAVLSAQIASIPVSVMLFGEFSIIAVIANLILIPIVGIVFIAIWIGVILSSIFGAFQIFAFIPAKALYLINLLVTAFDYNAFIIGGFALGAFIVLIFLSMFILGGYLNLKSVLRYTTAFCLVVICTIGSVVTTLQVKGDANVYVSGKERISATIIEDKDESVLIISNLANEYSLSRLARAISQLNDSSIEIVVFLNGYSANYQAFLSKLYHYCTFKQILYYGEKDLFQENAVLKSFPFAKMRNIKEEDVVLGNYSFSLKMDGFLVETLVREKKIAVLSKFSALVDYSVLAKDYYLLVAYSNVENVLAVSNPKNAVSYLGSSFASDAKTNGNVKYLI